MIDRQKAKAEIDEFAESCRLGQIVDETGLIHPPPLLTAWDVYVDGEKADRVPADDRSHALELRGPSGVGHMQAEVRVKPNLRIVN